MRVFLRYVAAWLAAATVSAVLISLISSQLVLHGLIEVGAQVSFADRAQMTVADLAILQTLVPVTLACFLVGFLVAGLCLKLLFGPRWFWFSLAGGSAIIATFVLMSVVMNLMPIAGARGTLGMALIGIAGTIGGWLFARLTSPNNGPFPNRPESQ